MTFERFDAGHHVLTFEVPWEADRQFRTNPEVLTSLLREQVPVLDFVQWRVLRVEPGEAESELPLNAASTNQHFTHQAALFLLAADYTGGIAVGSLMTGWPVVGVHPVHSTKSMALWLLKGEIKYLRPSVSDLRVCAVIEPERCSRIQRRFLDGKPVIETVRICFSNGSTKVAEAELTYFARQSEKLRANGLSADKVNILYELRLTSSAELIAGVRARESGRLFHDPYAAQMAGHHGLALAERFCQRSPQLGGMVAARTRHLDESIADFVAQGGRDLVILGVGWDMRAFRLPLPQGTRVYELDFPSTLAERRRRLDQLAIQTPPGVQRIELPIDLRTMSLADTLAPHVKLQRPLLIAWEGMSMYFEEEEVDRVLRGMLPLLECPGSRLWLDVVDQQAVLHSEAFPAEVQSFMRGMQILGEPFTFGVESIQQYMESKGFACWDVVTSDAYFPNSRDPVYSLYKFCVASQRAAVGALKAESRLDRADLPSPVLARPHTALPAVPVAGVLPTGGGPLFDLLKDSS